MTNIGPIQQAGMYKSHLMERDPPAVITIAVRQRTEHIMWHNLALGLFGPLFPYEAMSVRQTAM